MESKCITGDRKRSRAPVGESSWGGEARIYRG